MIQDENTQTSHPNNNIIEEVGEQQLHAIVGGGCPHCNSIAGEATKTAKDLQRIKDSNSTKASPALLGKASETYHKLAQQAQGCRGCEGIIVNNQLAMLDDLTHRIPGLKSR